MRTKEEIFERSISTTSVERQVMHLSEEISEMMIEISHLVRGRTSTKEKLVEEIADVQIMIDEMKYLFGVTEKDIEEITPVKMAKFEKRVFAE